jgi:hypothetical protein
MRAILGTLLESGAKEHCGSVLVYSLQPKGCQNRIRGIGSAEIICGFSTHLATRCNPHGPERNNARKGMENNRIRVPWKFRQSIKPRELFWLFDSDFDRYQNYYFRKVK